KDHAVSYSNTSVPIRKWVAKPSTLPSVFSSYDVGLGHNLFSVGQFCDGDLEDAFRSKTCNRLTSRERAREEYLCVLFGTSLYDNALTTPVGYFEKRSLEVSINSAAQPTPNNDDTPSLSSIIIKDHEAPPFVSSSEE
ncbi:hypothetical protein Tco_0837251, partial [Tanacetum coccineum]